MLPRNLTLICGAFLVCFCCRFIHARTRTAMMVGEAMQMIEQFYVEPVDERKLLIAAMNGMTSQLDRHSEFIPPRDYVTFQDSIQQEFAGIGIFVDQPVKGEPVRVVTPLVGSPALEAGLLPDDRIIRVDDEPVGTMEIQQVSERLRGPIGTTVDLLVRRVDHNQSADITDEDRSKATQDVSIQVRRDTIELESVIGDYRDENSRWVFRLKKHPEIAYVRMTSFGDKTVRELAEILTRMNNDFDGLVLDLRGNGGGLLTAAVDVADMFLNDGKIVSTKTRGGVVEDEMFATPGSLVAPDRPVAILIDQNSASASEIVAAALQDHDRALIVGMRSFGKGTVQNILPLEYGRSALRLTVAKYFRPSDQNIHRGKEATDSDVWGVSPTEGFLVDLDEAERRRLFQLWQIASYPSLRGTASASVPPVPAEVPTADDALPATPIDPNATSWDLDMQLQKAVEGLRASAREKTFEQTMPAAA